MNLNKIQKKIDEFVESNSSELLTTKEYIIYLSNLLFGLSLPMIALNPDLNNLDPLDYYSVESFYLKSATTIPYLELLIIAHKLIAISSEFSDE